MLVAGMITALPDECDLYAMHVVAIWWCRLLGFKTGGEEAA